MTDFVAHLTRQGAVSQANFGPGPRTKGVIDHLKKEIREVEKVYEENDGNPDMKVHADAALEWADIAILGLDGLIRAVAASRPGWSFDAVAAEAVRLIVQKQGINEKRDWPDWRTAPADKAIEHDRT